MSPCFAHQGGPMLPGTISASSIPAPLQTSTPSHTLGCAATSAPTHMPSNALLPLAYWYGHEEAKRNPLLLDRLIRNLGENVSDRLEGDTQGMCGHEMYLRSCRSRGGCIAGRASGIIVDTPSAFAASTSLSSEHRQSLIKACVDAFRSNFSPRSYKALSTECLPRS